MAYLDMDVQQPRDYSKLREVLFGNDYEKYFEWICNLDNMTDYLYNFQDIVEWLEELNEEALEREDYEFCKVLVDRMSWATWKLKAINSNIYSEYK
tara:strand:+ start:1061 stop:1348 length:288 start_codon:yes stop_codon:yes gene_type:complete